MSKGSNRRPENYAAVLANWDKAFGYEDDYYDPPVRKCPHKHIDEYDGFCSMCGKTVREILREGDGII